MDIEYNIVNNFLNAFIFSGLITELLSRSITKF